MEVCPGCKRVYPCICRLSYSCDHPMIERRGDGTYCTECQQRVA